MEKGVGVGTRVVNFLVDTLVVFILTFLFNKFWEFKVYYWGYPYVPFYLLMVAMTVLYYTIFEIINGRSVGKYVTISKVVNVQGGKPSFLQILIRSIFRVFPLDFLLIPFKDITVHDWISKTRVVEK